MAIGSGAVVVVSTTSLVSATVVVSTAVVASIVVVVSAFDAAEVASARVFVAEVVMAVTFSDKTSVEVSNTVVAVSEVAVEVAVTSSEARKIARLETVRNPIPLVSTHKSSLVYKDQREQNRRPKGQWLREGRWNALSIIFTND